MSHCSVNLAGREALAADLESDPKRLPAHHGVSWLMDRTCESTDPADKTRLAVLELRARGVLERFRKANVN